MASNCKSCCKPIEGDFVLCSGECKGEFHFQCSIDENAYRKLVAKKKNWKCADCLGNTKFLRSKSVTDESSTDNQSQPDLRGEIRTMKDILCNIDTKLADIKEIKLQLVRVEESQEFISRQYEEIKAMMETNNREVNLLKKQVKTLVEENNEKDGKIRQLHSKVEKLEQYNRRRTVEIHQLPRVEDENCFEIVKSLGEQKGVKIEKQDVEGVYRIAVRDQSRIPPLVIQFQSKSKKEEFCKGRRLRIREGQNRGKEIFINDNLSPHFRQLMMAAKGIARNRGYKFVWYKEEKVLVRKTDTSEIIYLESERDLQKLN